MAGQAPLPRLPEDVVGAGQHVPAVVPDTLDLAARAALALNVLTKNPDPVNHYRVWQSMQFDTNPPHLAAPNWLTAKFLESLPMMRVMCGDDLNASVELDMMRDHLRQIGPDGLLYEPSGTSSFQRGGVAVPFTNGRMILAMLAWHARDGDPAWLGAVDRMVRGLADVAIRRHEYAFHPLESGHAPGRGWQYTGRTGHAYFPYTPPDEPSREQQGIEGTVKENAHVLRAVVRWYEISGDPAALELARKLAAFYLLPAFWEDGAAIGIVGPEHGLFAGHGHGNLIGLRALLRIAVATGDEGLKQFVRASYEFARSTGIPRMGWFTGWLQPERHGRPPFLRTIVEGCHIADMVALAVKLSDAGALDCWDDVDHYVRNQLIEHQAVDLDLMQRSAADGRPFTAEPPVATTEDVIGRSLGGFSGFGEPTCLPQTGFHGCCTGNCTQALYYAWEGITRFQDGTAQINLLLNRAAPWLEVESCLPYEGKVVVRNRQAATIALRVPGWVDRTALHFRLDGATAVPAWAGNFAMFSGIKPGMVLDAAFPVPEQQYFYTAGGVRYSCTFRGSTLVDIAPRNSPPASYPIYQRDHLKSTLAPTTEATRFIADRVLAW